MLWVLASTMCNNAVTFYKFFFYFKQLGGFGGWGEGIGIFDKIIFRKISHLEKYIGKDACFFFNFFFGVTTFDLIILWMMVTSATLRKLRKKKKKEEKALRRTLH
jgi:hypothetical protein